MKKVLAFLSLMSDDGKCLSLTNIALIALVVKMMIAKEIDWPSAVTLATVFANYAHKRSSRGDEATLSEAVNDVKEKITPVVDAIKDKI